MPLDRGRLRPRRDGEDAGRNEDEPEHTGKLRLPAHRPAGGQINGTRNVSIGRIADVGRLSPTEAGAVEEVGTAACRLSDRKKIDQDTYQR